MKGMMNTAQPHAGSPTLAPILWPAGSRLRAFSKLVRPRPSCRMLLEQALRRAASRAVCTAGSSRPMSVAMIAITTSSSTSVKPRRGNWRVVSIGLSSGIGQR